MRLTAGNRVAVTLSLAVVVSLASACGGPTKAAAPGDPMPSLDGGISRAWQARPAIVQTVRLLTPGVRQGDTLRIESRLKNVSLQSVNIHRLVCEVDIETTLEVEGPFIHCIIGEMNGPLAPGEEDTRTVSRRILSPPGRYTVSIRHLLQPSVWVTAELTVYPRE